MYKQNYSFLGIVWTLLFRRRIYCRTLGFDVSPKIPFTASRFGHGWFDHHRSRWARLVDHPRVAINHRLEHLGRVKRWTWEISWRWLWVMALEHRSWPRMRLDYLTYGPPTNINFLGSGVWPTAIYIAFTWFIDMPLYMHLPLWNQCQGLHPLLEGRTIHVESLWYAPEEVVIHKSRQVCG